MEILIAIPFCRVADLISNSTKANAGKCSYSQAGHFVTQCLRCRFLPENTLIIANLFPGAQTRRGLCSCYPQKQLPRLFAQDPRDVV